MKLAARLLCFCVYILFLIYICNENLYIFWVCCCARCVIQDSCCSSYAHAWDRSHTVIMCVMCVWLLLDAEVLPKVCKKTHTTHTHTEHTILRDDKVEYIECTNGPRRWRCIIHWDEFRPTKHRDRSKKIMHHEMRIPRDPFVFFCVGITRVDMSMMIV